MAEIWAGAWNRLTRVSPGERLRRAPIEPLMASAFADRFGSNDGLQRSQMAAPLFEASPLSTTIQVAQRWPRRRPPRFRGIVRCSPVSCGLARAARRSGCRSSCKCVPPSSASSNACRSVWDQARCSTPIFRQSCYIAASTDTALCARGSETGNPVHRVCDFQSRRRQPPAFDRSIRIARLGRSSSEQ